jgi:hypothetical protein
MAVSPLEKCRVNYAPKGKRLSARRWQLVCFLLFLFLSGENAVWAIDPSLHITQYARTAWRIQDGVFSGSPNAITQTTNGYLWIGTQAGLPRFDGIRFVPWTSPDGKHLPSSHVTALLGARGGSGCLSSPSAVTCPPFTRWVILTVDLGHPGRCVQAHGLAGADPLQ